MSIRPYRLEVDNTGVNPNNLVVDEPYALQGTGKRFIVTRNGPFYTDPATLRIIDLATGLPLAPRTQYTAVQLEEEATMASGKEVCSIIIIDDPAVSDNVTVTYQAYGGWMSYSVTGILEMIQAIDLDSRVIHWADIVGKPDRYAPAPHAHPLSDIYGWSKLFPVLTAIRDAILIGDQSQFDTLRQGFSAEIARLDQMDALIQATLTAHMGNTSNPHGTDAHQVGAYFDYEVDALLTGYLPLHATADNAAKLENRNFAQARAEIVDSIQNSELDNGLFNKANLGENWDQATPSLILTQAGWKAFKAFETTYGRNINELGGYTTAQINSMLGQYLPLYGTAADSSKLESKTLSQVLAAAYAQVGSMGKRNVYISSSGPSGGASGDIWLQY